MHFLDVLFYYYYCFYANIFKEKDPGFTTKLAISASESFLIVAIVSMIYSYFSCKKFGRTEFIIITLVVLAINFFVLLKSSREEAIIKKEPKFFNSNTASVIITWIFFLVTTSILFWLNDAVNAIIDNCK